MDILDYIRICGYGLFALASFIITIIQAIRQHKYNVITNAIKKAGLDAEQISNMIEGSKQTMTSEVKTQQVVVRELHLTLTEDEAKALYEQTGYIIGSPIGAQLRQTVQAFLNDKPGA